MGGLVALGTLIAGAVASVLTIITFGEAAKEAIEAGINKFKKAGALGKATTVAIATTLGLGITLGTAYRLNEINKKEDQAYKFAYSEFDKIENTFIQFKLKNQLVLPPKEMTECFKDAAAKSYVAATIRFFGDPKAEDTGDVNKRYEKTYGNYIEGVSKGCFFISNKSALPPNTKEGVRLGEYFRDNVVLRPIVNVANRNTTAESNVTFDLELR